MSRWGLITTLLMNIPPIILMIVAVVYKTYQYDETDNVLTEQEIKEHLS